MWQHLVELGLHISLTGVNLLDTSSTGAICGQRFSQAIKFPCHPLLSKVLTIKSAKRARDSKDQVIKSWAMDKTNRLAPSTSWAALVASDLIRVVCSW
jgi:hypothetical protein